MFPRHLRWGTKLSKVPVQLQQHQVGALGAADEAGDAQPGVVRGGVEVTQAHLHAVVAQVRNAAHEEKEM